MWEGLSKEMIINSIKSSALRLAVDGFDNDKVSCFHESKKTSNWRKRLEKQMKLSSICELTIIVAAPSFTIIDENDDEDISIEY